ncbi:MAG: zinc ribbon domain-containing protein [Candidatus Thermoplasmatota archaeon]|nr:zinc ribbon domain-containing protein [Candidatus Thermoplasmatota archaeon]
MAPYPVRCPSCGEPNDSGLNFCPVCGDRFKVGTPTGPYPVAATGKYTSNNERLRKKKLRKRAELFDLYRKKKITREQFDRGMENLGYSSDVDQVLAFKKFIREQIQAFERMEVDGGVERGSHSGHLRSEADLPRDRYGNVITDFSVPSRPAGAPPPHTSHQKPSMISARPISADHYSGGLSSNHRKTHTERSLDKGDTRRMVRKGHLKKERSADPGMVFRSRPASNLEWDEDEEEVFEIDHDDREGEGDNDPWELEWGDDGWEDPDIPMDGEEDEEWESWEERPSPMRRSRRPTRTIVEFLDEEYEDEEVFDPLTFRPGNRRKNKKSHDRKRQGHAKSTSGDRRRRDY